VCGGVVGRHAPRTGGGRQHGQDEQQAKYARQKSGHNEPSFFVTLILSHIMAKKQEYFCKKPCRNQTNRV
jgi:hypothetical protein